MIIKEHHSGDKKIAEIIAEDILIYTAEDGLQLLGDLYFQGFDNVILYEKNLSADFFDLKTKIAGEILQKFAQYRMPLCIVGKFSSYDSSALTAFMHESNRGQHINFVSTQAEALKRWMK
jgi:hypothetical protein